MTRSRDDRPLWLLVNQASGSNSDEAVAEVIRAFAAGDWPVARCIDLADGAPTPAALAAAGVGTLAVFAGDGTLNAVGTALEGWDGGLLALPGGTANLLARAVHGDRSAAAIARDASRLRPVRRQCIRSRHGTALIEILAGPGAAWGEVREGLRAGGLGDVAGRTVEAIRQSTAGPMVALIEPSLGRADGYAGVRLEVSDDAMLVEGFGPDTVADYLRQGLALLRRNFREGPHDTLGTHGAVVCRSSEQAAIPLMIDGELREGGAEERFFLAPFALDLLAPGP